jgi:nucleoid-associated protein YgaU
VRQRIFKPVATAETTLSAPAPKSGPADATATAGKDVAASEGVLAPRPFQAEPLLEPGQIKIVDQDGRIVIYRVRRGDTLWGISKRYTGSGFNYPQLAEDNEIENPDLIFPKQRITVK